MKAGLTIFFLLLALSGFTQLGNNIRIKQSRVGPGGDTATNNNNSRAGADTSRGSNQPSKPTVNNLDNNQISGNKVASDSIFTASEINNNRESAGNNRTSVKGGNDTTFNVHTLEQT